MSDLGAHWPQQLSLMGRIAEATVLTGAEVGNVGVVTTLTHAPGVRYEDLPTYWVFSLEVTDDIRYYRRD